jgi:copper chaperone
MIKLLIQGMTCEHCRSAVKTGLESVTGVSSAEVHLENGSAQVEGTASLNALIEAVQEEGYHASSEAS